MVNLIANKLGINAMGYPPPALALGWLFAFSQVGEVGAGYPLFGVAVIIFANAGAGIARPALKTMASFLNTGGGTLVIGVADDGEPLGIGKDNFRSEDRMKPRVANIVKDRMTMGAAAMARGLVRSDFCDYREGGVPAARCGPAGQPVYVNDGNDNRFYVRAGPATTGLSAREAVEYISVRFPSRGGAARQGRG